MTVSVMIATKGRIVDLRRTCRVLQQLSPPPLEVLITVDGSTADVVEALKAELPQARVFVNQVGADQQLSVSLAELIRQRLESRADVEQPREALSGTVGRERIIALAVAQKVEVVEELGPGVGGVDLA